MVSFDLEKGSSFATLPRAEKRENHCQEVKDTFPLLSESSIPFPYKDRKSSFMIFVGRRTCDIFLLSIEGQPKMASLELPSIQFGLKPANVLCMFPYALF